MSRPSDCHPDRPNEGGGLCKRCYQRRWKRQRRRLPERTCDLCGDPFHTSDSRRRDCSKLCRVVRNKLEENPRPPGEEMMATRDAKLAASLLRAYLDRGCRRVGRKAAGQKVEGPYVAAWHRGEGLFIVRARLPEAYREEAA